MVDVHSFKLVRKNLIIPWGFQVVGGNDLEIPLTIQKITPSSVADIAGLRPGDGILTINGRSTEDLSNVEAQEIIGRSGLKLILNVRRIDFRAIGTPVLKRSEVYRMVQEEQRQTKTVQKTSASPEPTFQSQSFIRIQRTLDESGRPISPGSPTPGSEARKGAPSVPLSGPHAQSVPTHVAEQQRETPRPPSQPFYQQQHQPYRQQQPPFNQPQHQQQQQYRPPPPSSDYNQQARAPPTSPVHEREPVRQQQFPQQQATPPPRAQPAQPPYQQQQPSEYRPTPQQQPSEYRPTPQQQQPSEYRPTPQQQQPQQRPTPQQPQPQPQPEYKPPAQAEHRSHPEQTTAAQKGHRRQEPYRYQAAGTGYQAPPMNSVSPSGRRRPVWPPPSSVPALQTSTQSIHWIGSKGQKKFVWPPPKAFTSYDYDEALRYRQGEGIPTRGEAQERADSFIVQPGSRAVPRSHPRAPARLAAQAWEPYLGAQAEGRHPLHRRNPRRTRRFEEVITMSNSTRLPPTYRPPPGTQHIVLDYEFESEEEEEEEEED